MSETPIGGEGSRQPPAPSNLGTADTVVAPAPTCPSTVCNMRCELGVGHEDPKHPDHLADQWGEILHANQMGRWPVDAAGCKQRTEARKVARAAEREKRAKDIREG